MPPASAANPAATDSHVTAYCLPVGPEVFSAIVHGTQIWTPDPFDVETIHAEAREVFARLLNRASSSDLPPHGKSLLLQGESGSGKTHLLRAFRTTAHAAGFGYCGYLQLISRADNYARYVLSNVIDSLEQPYKPGTPDTGLSRLARGLLDALDVVPDEDKRKLCEDVLEPDELARLVYRLADFAVQYPRFRGIDIDLIRAILFTIPNDGRVRARVLKWLRCEDLNRFDRELIGDLVPRPGPEMPLNTLTGLGRLVHAIHSAAFVLLVDQMEQVFDLDRKDEEQGEVLRQVVNTVVDVMDGVPNAVVVLGCLEDTFVKSQRFLSMAKLDRLLRDPDPVRLSGRRTPDEIAAMIARRLEGFFDAVGIDPDPQNPIDPYAAADIGGLVPFRPRDILDNLRRHREACIAAKGWVTPNWSTIVVPPPTDWAHRWNDFHTSYNSPVLSDEPKLAELLAFTIRTVSGEMPNEVHFGADPDGRFVPVEVHQPANVVEKLFVAVCDKSTRGGGLTNQIRDVAKKAGEIPAVLVRSTEFPNKPDYESVKLVTPLIAPRGKGRKVVTANSDWRAMAAFREFHQKHHTQPGFADWQRTDRPLSQLRAVNAILALDKLLAAPPVAPTTPSVPPPPAGLPKEIAQATSPPPTPPAATATNAVRLGQTRSSTPTAIELEPKSLCRHAAFLGGPGSGKTTAALTAIEQLLLAGVPVVMLDRKGDLARYADPTAWTDSEPDPDRAARRDRLRTAIDVALYTPGKDAGRPLAIPVAPPDLGQASAADREQFAQFAAAALGVMLGYKSRTPDPKLVILQKAIETLAAVPGRAVTVKALQQLVADQDDALLAAFDGQYEARLFTTLARDLLTLSIRHRRLLEGTDTLDVNTLLGRGSAAVPGKARLTIISTQFLDDAGTADFWVSQLLLAVERWMQKSPAPDGALQAVFLFDEADRYLPAVGKPATKGPMESLLKRARSAGVGIFLATQSPGDLDYRCRDQVLTWLIGRVKESVAIGKLKPMLEARPGAAEKLADQKTGEFYLVRESDVVSVQMDRNLIPTAQLPEERILELARPTRR